jgi:hypothetical protein
MPFCKLKIELLNNKQTQSLDNERHNYQIRIQTYNTDASRALESTAPIIKPLGIKTCDINCIDRAISGPCGNVSNVER